MIINVSNNIQNFLFNFIYLCSFILRLRRHLRISYIIKNYKIKRVLLARMSVEVFVF